MLVGLLLVTRGGSLLKHTLGVLLLAWRRILLASAAAAVAGVLIGEIGAVIITGLVPPPLMAHLVVLIFAAVLAYSTALTVFLEEILHGLVNTIRMIEGDAAAGARAAAVIAEREAGEAGSGLMRLFGRRSPPQPPAETTARAFVAPTVDSMRSIEIQQSEADFDATEAFVTTSPRPRVDARPVRADQLPRIGWAASGPHSSGSDEPPATADADAPTDDGSDLSLALPEAALLAPAEVQPEPSMSTVERKAPSQPSTSVQPATLAPIPVRTPVVSSPAGVSAADADTPSAEPATPSSQGTPGEPWTPPSAVTVLPPGTATDDALAGGYGGAARPTRPLRPSRPLDSAPDAPSGRGIWSRISQALVGNTSSPSTPLAPDAPADDKDRPTA